ncbi:MULTISPECIES: YbaB/EbfC family nucleoid-associated protein [Commensalibacter]|uniref:Nucleoid-associated protein COMX_04990 n=2 Tax=Commensalibacter TaxID=1079922 RepID=W7DXY0_9PROT|nr:MULTISPECIES: YbaB/EbfC family nucleoid-associated protein [Commensalibacter]EUK19078.1 hypothetical protein COMX_04990 [Commensalibacter papalotli (ex Servin-Garciduenas et al. 2014)]CAI3922949.1 DNA-binding nucleoid-associated protein YbaB/EfbC (YbaB) (PDB:1J8B) (PUBMED:19594923 [Commensalibacter papalotli (ex Botero et al. 2024)]CAI3929085.1 DNA-binding nucleoid-associated protein YbaB/EfbC (YbaB) (PDB:1J8B) (PUBMED:19594923 [Commensalibacter papalotli (ex Botero et al. 2024)]
MKNFANLMKQASQMQSKMNEMQEKLALITVEGVSGAGMVTVELAGKGEMKSIKIDPKLADANEMEILQDLIVAAYTEARRRLDEKTKEEMQKVTGGMNLPEGLNLPF